MAQISYRGNLSAKVFPFVSEYFGRSIIIPGPDQNFSRQLSSSEDLDKDKGTPQIYYCHNVMPTADGFQSIGFTDRIVDTKLGFMDEITLRDLDGNEVFYSHLSDGNNYILPFGSTSWIEINYIPGTLGKAVSSATINGQSYIYFANVGCYMYQASTNTLVPITLTGLTPAAVIGITNSFGYMIAWGANSIAWSSTVEHSVPTDPIDFVPSLITGAGGGNVEEAQSVITLCREHYLGFIIYTEENAIAAVYSGNARFPFNLRPIVGSGGVANKSLLSTDSGSGNHYAYTSSGLQLVSISSTQTVFPEITDFLAGKYFEDFNETTLTMAAQVLSSLMKKALNVVSDRYLVISYGVSVLTHALIFDLVQKRFGKIKLTHTKCFEWKSLEPEITETPRDSIGFLQTSGSIKTVDFGYGSTTSSGVMLLGKYQYVRTRLLTLDSIEFENVRQGNTFAVYDMIAIQGKSTTTYPTYLALSEGNYRRYTLRATGVEHSILAIGNFYMTSFQMNFHSSGRR